MEFKCLECGDIFPSKKSFHCHLKAHAMRIGDYYVKYYGKRDLFTKNLLQFKNYEQYFREDFSCFENYASWINSEDKDVVAPYLLKKAREKIEEKQLRMAKSNQ